MGPPEGALRCSNWRQLCTPYNKDWDLITDHKSIDSILVAFYEI